MGGKHLYIVAAILVCAGATATAQTTGDISGRVTDASGTPLAGATVKATSPSLPGARVTATDRDGWYRISAIPPGTYLVVASLPGLRPAERACIVTLGSAMTVDLRLQIEAEEKVRVSGEVLIDTNSTATGTSYTSQIIGHLPVARNYADVIRANPGVTTDINSYTTDARFLALSIYGATSEENQWFIDGVATTQVLFGSQGKAIHNEFVQEVAVMTGGYSAEYGRSLGGVVTAITKSGGNEFHGDAFSYFDSVETTAGNQFTPLTDSDLGASSMRTVDGKNFDYGFSLGGFLLKDRLWFFGAYNRISSQSELSRAVATTFVSTEDRFPLDNNSNYYSGKLTWNVAAGTTVVGSVFADPSTRSGLSGNAPVVTDPTTWNANLHLGGADYGLRLTRLFGSSAIATMQGSYHEDQSALNPADTIRYADWTCAGGTPGRPCTPPNQANAIHGGYGFVPVLGNTHSTRKQLASNATLTGRDNEFRFGGDYMDGQAWAKRFFTGGQGVGRYNEYGQPYYRHNFYALNPANPTVFPSAGLNAQVLDYSAYVQDSWRPASNLTVNVGLRWDGEDTRTYAGASVLRFNTWQPRFGVVWDPWRDGATKVYVSAGRFSYALPLFTAAAEFGSRPYNIYTYNFDPVGIAQDPNVLNHSRVRIIGTGGPFGIPVDSGVQGARQDELTVGVERLVLPTLQVGLKGTYRRLGNALEDRCDFDYTNPELNGSSCVLINPGSNGRFASGNAPVCNGLDDPFYQCFPSGPPTPAAKRTYRGIELSARDTVGEKAWLQASYVYSSLLGNYGKPNDVSSDFDYPQLWHNAYGALDLDRTNRFQLDGFWVSPFHLSVGLQAFAETGAPLSKLGYFSGNYPASIFLTPRGSEGRLPTLWGANLTLGYPIAMGPVTTTVQAYLYNVFNKQIATSEDQFWTTSTPEGYPATILDPNQAQNNPDYGKVTGRSAPRLFRAALRISF